MVVRARQLRYLSPRLSHSLAQLLNDFFNPNGQIAMDFLNPLAYFMAATVFTIMNLLLTRSKFLRNNDGGPGNRR